LVRSRFKVEVQGEGGERISIAVDGHLSRDKVAQVLDFIDLIAGAGPEASPANQAEMTKFDKLRIMINRRFSMGWFTSQEAMITYEDVFDEPLGPSTVSTYLARLVSQDVLVRSGSSAMRRYRKKRISPKSEKELVER
jgi:hypothetical protein